MTPPPPRPAPARAWPGVLRAALLAAAVLAACAHALGMLPLRFVTQLDLAIADARLRAFMPRTPDARIAIVDVDEKSLAELGRWPWGRDRMAALADELFARQRAAVVGFDVLFAEPDASSGLPVLERLAADSPAIARELAARRDALDNDARFARALQGRRAVLGFYLSSEPNARRTGVLPAPLMDPASWNEGPSPPGGAAPRVTRWNGYASNLPVFAQAAPAAGFFNAVPDADGQVRRVPLIAEIDGRPYEPLALAMLRSYTGAAQVVPVAPAAFGRGAMSRGIAYVELRQGAERLAIPVDALARAIVPYRGPGGPHGGSFEYLSAADLIGGRVAPGHLAGRLVLVGSTAPGVYDMRATPVAEVFPGVEVHANLLSGLLDARLPAEPDWAGGFALAQLLAVAALLGLLLPRLRAAQGALLAAAVVTLLIAGNLWAYRAHALVLPLAGALLLAALLYTGLTVWGYVTESRSRRLLARLFGSYVPPELVEEMARDPARYDMRAENRVLTIMFCDMRNFTRVSERLAPEEVRALVNRFFSAMTGVIRARRGTLDKYIGDALMAFWGAPLPDECHAAHAVEAALAMTEALRALNDDLRARGLPPIGVGIGLNTGLVCVGDMGSSVRRSYTAMGDAVNLASRIEALTRHYGVDVLAGEATRDASVGAAGDAAIGDGTALDAATGAAAARDGDGALRADGDRAPPRWIEVDRVRVKGKERPVTLFTPLSAAAAADPTLPAQLRLWRLVLAAYRLQHWDEARAGLQRLRAEHPDSPLAGVHRLMEQRIADFRSAPPPPGWDGAHTFDSK